jgi:hypothetical protein
MKKDQGIIIIEQLEKHQKISRNWCLDIRISRLGARIHDLWKSGWRFEDDHETESGAIRHGRIIKTRFGEDYIYFLKSSPNK